MGAGEYKAVGKAASTKMRNDFVLGPKFDLELSFGLFSNSKLFGRFFDAKGPPKLNQHRPVPSQKSKGQKKPLTPAGPRHEFDARPARQTMTMGFINQKRVNIW